MVNEQDGELEARLRRHFSAGAPTVDGDELVREVGAMTDLQRRRGPVRWLLATGGLATVLAAVLVGAWLISARPAGPPVSGFPSASHGDAAAPSPRPSGWTRGLMDGGTRETAMASVAWNGTRYVAIGSVQVAAAIWASTDGTHWSKVPSLPGPARVYLLDLISTPSGFVAVGYRSDFASSAPDQAVVWRSTDGLSWNSVPDQAPLDGGHMTEVAQAKDRYVAVGVAQLGELAAWTSVDGTRWTRSSAPLGGPGSSVADIAAFHGAFIAVGQDVEAAGEVGAIWRSTDGSTWQRLPAEVGPGALTALTQLSDQLVAVGGDGQQAIVWVSDDGQTWRAREAPSSPGLVAVATERADLVAAAGYPDASLWRSSGLAWTKVQEIQLSTGDWIRALATGRSIIAVGDDGSAPLSWLEP